VFDIAPVDQEAARQYELLYPHIGTAADRDRTCRMICAGIRAMCERGAARVTDEGTVEFWSPRRGLFVLYDQEYNSEMLAFMGEFKALYRRDC